MSFYADDGSWNISVVDGLTYTGLQAADGSTNVVQADGVAYVGAYHPCGALWVTVYTGTDPVPVRAADGSFVINNTTGMPSKNQGQPVTVVSGVLV